jgi:hypothetical protein
MANVISHKLPVHHLAVSITGVDKDRILAQSKYQGLSVTRITKILGMSRQYFYQCLDEQQFEISKFIHLQALLGIELVPRSSIQDAYNLLVDSMYANLPGSKQESTDTG